jgi:hypothetical protein
MENFEVKLYPLPTRLRCHAAKACILLQECIAAIASLRWNSNVQLVTPLLSLKCVFFFCFFWFLRIWFEPLNPTPNPSTLYLNPKP